MSVASSSVPQGSASNPLRRASATRRRPVEVWPAVVLVALYWIVYAIPPLLEAPIFASFLTSVVDTLVLTLGFVIWWLISKKITRPERWWGLAVLVGGALAAIAVSQKTLGTVGVLIFGLPTAFTVWALWLVVGSLAAAQMRTIGLVAVLALTWGAVSMLRMDGLTGDLHAAVTWRWAPKSEDLYLAERAAKSEKSAEPARTNGTRRESHACNRRLARLARANPRWCRHGRHDRHRLGKASTQAGVEATRRSGVVIVRRDRQSPLHAGATRRERSDRLS